ncbi:MAG: SMI1/KNR4 family protein [Planctomycetota bacterium]
MFFKALIETVHGNVEFNPPVSQSALQDFIANNGVLPSELSSLLQETDGVRVGEMVSIFSIEPRIGYTFQSVIEEWTDPEYESLYPNSLDLFFFADDGMGGFFGYRQLAEQGGAFGPICYWDHETDEVRELKEQGLAGFIRTCDEYLA